MVQISHLLCLVSYGGASVFNMKKNCVGLGCLLPVLGGQMPTDFVKIEQKSNMATANYQADHAGSRRHRCRTEVRYENVLPGLFVCLFIYLVQSTLYEVCQGLIKCKNIDK